MITSMSDDSEHDEIEVCRLRIRELERERDSIYHTLGLLLEEIRCLRSVLSENEFIDRRDSYAMWHEAQEFFKKRARIKD